MTHEQIRPLLHLLLDSPNDRVTFSLDARIGAGVQLPLLGHAELFVRGKGVVEAEMDSTGRCLVSFDARLTGGGEAGTAAVGKAMAETGGYSKITYLFPNDEEAAKYIQSLMHQLHLAPPAPSFTPPIPKVHHGRHSELIARMGPLFFFGKRQDEVSEMSVPLPWRPRQERHTVRIQMAREVALLQIRLGPAAGVLKVRTDDLKDLVNQAAKGTTLHLELKASVLPMSGAGELQLADGLLEVVGHVRPDLLARPGLREQLAERLKGQMRGSLSTLAGVQLLVHSPRSFLMGEGGHCTDALVDYVASLADPGRPRWEPVATYANRDHYADGRIRLPGIGFGLFADAGFELDTRDSTTLKGSPLHARQLLYGSWPGVRYTTRQLKELEKDGILYDQGASQGSFLEAVRCMRDELNGLYSEEGRGQSREQFAQNVENFLKEVADSVWGGRPDPQR